MQKTNTPPDPASAPEFLAEDRAEFSELFRLGNLMLDEGLKASAACFLRQLASQANFIASRCEHAHIDQLRRDLAETSVVTVEAVS